MPDWQDLPGAVRIVDNTTQPGAVTIPDPQAFNSLPLTTDQDQEVISVQGTTLEASLEELAQEIYS